MLKYVLSFDPSLSCTGYAVFNVTNGINLIEYGTVNTNTVKTKKHNDKLFFIHVKIKDIKDKYGEHLQYIIIEKGFSRFNASTQAIYKARGVIESVFPKLDFIEIPVSTVRLKLLGKGTKGKEDVKKWVSELFTLDKVNEDEADAIAVGYCGILLREENYEQKTN